APVTRATEPAALLGRGIAHLRNVGQHDTTLQLPDRYRDRAVSPGGLAARVSPRDVRQYRTSRPARRRRTAPASSSTRRWPLTAPGGRLVSAASCVVERGLPSRRRIRARFGPMRRARPSAPARVLPMSASAPDTG